MESPYFGSASSVLDAGCRRAEEHVREPAHFGARRDPEPLLDGVGDVVTEPQVSRAKPASVLRVEQRIDPLLFVGRARMTAEGWRRVGG